MASEGEERENGRSPHCSFANGECWSLYPLEPLTHKLQGVYGSGLVQERNKEKKRRGQGQRRWMKEKKND